MNTVRFSKKSVLTSLSIRIEQEELCIKENKEFGTPEKISEGRLEALVHVYKKLSALPTFTKATLGEYIKERAPGLASQFNLDPRGRTSQVKDYGKDRKVGFWTYRTYLELVNSWDLGYWS